MKDPLLTRKKRESRGSLRLAFFGLFVFLILALIASQSQESVSEILLGAKKENKDPLKPPKLASAKTRAELSISPPAEPPANIPEPMQKIDLRSSPLRGGTGKNAITRAKLNENLGIESGKTRKIMKVLEPLIECSEGVKRAAFIDAFRKQEKAEVILNKIIEQALNYGVKHSDPEDDFKGVATWRREDPTKEDLEKFKKGYYQGKPLRPGVLPRRKIADTLDHSAIFPERKNLMLWTGDYRFDENFRERHDCYRLETTEFGIGLGRILGNEHFRNDDPIYVDFVGSLYDHLSEVLVSSFRGDTVIISVSEKLTAEDFLSKTLARQEIPAICALEHVTRVEVYMRQANGQYYTKQTPDLVYDKNGLLPGMALSEKMIKDDIVEKLQAAPAKLKTQKSGNASQKYLHPAQLFLNYHGSTKSLLTDAVLASINAEDNDDPRATLT